MGALKLTYQSDEITANLRIVHKKACPGLGDQKTEVADLLGLDYYPFGSIMPGRSYNSNEYRFGFQGQEKDDEITGVTGSHLSYTYRIHDARIGRFLSVDPLTASYPHNSPYAFSENRVIDGVELEGLEYVNVNDANIEQTEADGANIGVTINGNCYTSSGIVDYNGNSYFNLGQHVEVDGDRISTFFVTQGQLEGTFPNASGDAISALYSTLNSSMASYGIETYQGLAHFLSQAGHEVGGFANGLLIEENLNYSVSGLIGTFGKYFYSGKKVDGKFNAGDYGRKEGQEADREGIANIAYANRMGNGGVSSGDGYNFRGRGIFQLTGKSTYSAFNSFLNETGVNIVTNPALLSTSNAYSIKSALWFFQTSVMNVLNINSTTVTDVTLKVNGGDNGLPDRKAIYERSITNLR